MWNFLVNRRKAFLVGAAGLMLGVGFAAFDPSAFRAMAEVSLCLTERVPGTGPIWHICLGIRSAKLLWCTVFVLWIIVECALDHSVVRSFPTFRAMAAQRAE